jgi:Amiloride-sensitive sodium channel
LLKTNFDKKMSQNFKSMYLGKIVRWGKSSSSHGIPNIFSTKNRAVRMMWVTFFIGSFSYCVYTIITSIVEYSQYKTTVSISKVQQVPQIFPAITLCNINSFSEKNDSLLNFLTTAVHRPECLEYMKTDRKCNQAKNQSEKHCADNKSKLKSCFVGMPFSISTVKGLIANYVTDDIIEKKNLGIEFNDLVFDCNFNRGRCNKNNFTRFWSHEYGNCFTFNADGGLTAVQKGFKTGLQLNVNISKF